MANNLIKNHPAPEISPLCRYLLRVFQYPLSLILENLSRLSFSLFKESGLGYGSSGSSLEAGPSRPDILDLPGGDPSAQRVPPGADALLTPWSFMYKPQALQTGSPSAFLLQRVVLVVWQLVQHRPARLDEDFKTSKQTHECTHRND